MSTPHEKLIAYLKSSGAEFRMIEHPPCRSSDESAAARASGGAPGAVGAKALIVNLSRSRELAMLVLPGFARLASNMVRGRCGKFRFADEDEIGSATGGLEPGMIPPFGAPLFDAIQQVVVDPAVVEAATIGFNAACLEKSIIMSGKAYAALTATATIAEISSEQ